MRFDRTQAAAPNVVPIRVDVGHNPLEGFSPEVPAKAPRPMRPMGPSPAVKTKWMVAFGACFAALAMMVAALYVRTVRPAPRIRLQGHATLKSRPEGATVIVDGISRGVSPVELDLTAGPHDVVFRTASSERRVDVKVDTGARVIEDVDMPAPRVSSGALEIVSDPPGAPVTVDGIAVGATPVTLQGVNAARHAVTVAQGSTSVNRQVDVFAGATASVYVSLAPKAGAGTGTLAVDSPLDLRILENGKLLGLSNGAPIALASGKHQLDLAADALELRVRRMVVIESGKPVRLSVAAPNGTLSVNASPWADVFIDGRSIGTTPLGAISVPVGSHEIVWRHPQFGEIRRTVVVGAERPARATVEMRQ